MNLTECVINGCISGSHETDVVFQFHYHMGKLCIIVNIVSVHSTFNLYTPSGLFYLNSLYWSISNREGVQLIIITMFYRNSCI